MKVLVGIATKPMAYKNILADSLCSIALRILIAKTHTIKVT
jgi:hypothetical protein